MYTLEVRMIELNRLIDDSRAPLQIRSDSTRSPLAPFLRTVGANQNLRPIKVIKPISRFLGQMPCKYPIKVDVFRFSRHRVGRCDTKEAPVVLLIKLSTLD